MTYFGRRCVGAFLAAAAVGVFTAPIYAKDQDDVSTGQTVEGAEKTAAKAVKDWRQNRSVEPQRQKSFRDGVQPVLSRCPSSARRSFLSSLVFVNGELGSARVSEVESCLGEEGIRKLYEVLKVDVGALYNNKKCVAECEIHKGETCTKKCGVLPCADNCGPDLKSSSPGFRGPDISLKGYVSLERLLSGCDSATAEGFLDSLTFANGRPAEADLGLLASCAKSSKDPIKDGTRP